MTKRTAMIMMIIALMVSSIFATPLFEGFEGTFPPTGWTNTIVTGHEWELSASSYSGNGAAAYNGTNHDGNEGILSSPRLDLTQGTADNLSFWYKAADWSGDQNDLYVEVSTDGGTNWVELAHLTNAEDYTQQSFDLEGITQTDDTYIRFRAIDDYGYPVLIDDIVGPTLYGTTPIVDLSAQSLTGDTTPTVNTVANYSVSVMNIGEADAAAFTVKLYDANDTELASVNATGLSAFGTDTYQLSFTPTVAGIMSIYASVESTEDVDLANNETSSLAIEVQNEETTVVTIGTGTETQYRAPYNLYYQSSLAQIIYPASDITAGGLITAIRFHANIVSTNIPAGLPINIWLGETTNTTITNFESSSNLTQVYQGTVDFVAGDGNYLFTLDTPYAYGGENLLVSIERPMDSAFYLISDVWYSTTCASGEMAYYNNDVNAPDPVNPPVATVSTLKPNVKLYFLTAGLGSISGVVTDGTNPIANAELSLVGENYSAVSGADGSYSFPYVPVGTYSLVASLHGYADTQIDNVVVAEDNATALDVTMTMLPIVNVTGQILASDTAAGIQASVELTGYDDYMFDTDATGNFSVAVFAGYEYAGVATAEGYNSTNFVANVGTTDLDLGTITVNEISYPASNVVAEIVGNDAEIVWNSAFQGGSGGAGFAESFENEFPPAGWSLQNTNATNNFAQYEEVVFSTSTATPTDGMYQVGVTWAESEQDEWLITPAFDCPAASNLTFDFYGHYGSENADHYTVKVTTDGGLNWTTLWDATNLPAADNHYDAPVAIDLSAYAGQSIQLAWNFYDGPNNNGLWFTTFIDNVSVGNGMARVAFNENNFTHVSKSQATSSIVSSRNTRNPYEPQYAHVTNNITRSLNDYTVYRLNFGDEASTDLWTELGTVTDTTYTDSDWSTLPAGTYEYAIVANYTNDVISTPAISNWLINGLIGSLTVTVTTNVGTVPVGATVTITSQNMNPDGEYPTYTVTTDDTGVASFDEVWFSTYDLTASLDGFMAVSLNDIVVDGDINETVQLNEVMIPANTVVAAVNDTQTSVNLTWEAPGTGGDPEWMHKDSGTNDNAVGLNATTGGTFSVAVKYEVAELQDYDGQFLSRIRYWPNSEGSYVLKVWTGNDGLTEVYSEAIDNPTIGEWNEVQMSQVVTIDASQALYIGYQITHAGGVNPAGIDAGPRVTGGDMIMMAGAGEWADLYSESNAQIDANWNIQAYVGWTTSRPISTRRVPVVARSNNEKTSYSFAKAATNNTITTRENRPAIGYNVYRLNTGNEADPTQWTLVGAVVTDQNFADNDWATVTAGFYKWAVKAVYTGGVEAPAAFSNELIKDMEGYIEGTVTNAVTSEPIENASVTINGTTMMTDNTGYYIFPLLQGVYTVTCTAQGFVSQTQDNVAVAGTQVSTVNFQLAQSSIVFEDGFESYNDFVLDFAPWTQIDNDGLSTYGIQNVTFENAYYTGSYIIFNPANTSPAVTSLVPYEGDKVAACFDAALEGGSPVNDDYLITPSIHIYDGGSVVFQAKSHTDQWGLERFNVGVSTTGTDIDDFTWLNGTSYLQAPLDWTEFSFSLNEYAGQDIHIAINCVSADAFAFFVDDFYIDSPNPTDENITTPVATVLNGNYPNPFNPTTTISYSVKKTGPVTIDIYNIRGQKVRSLVNDKVEAGSHVVTWEGDDNNGKTVSSGVYFYKMNAGSYTQTKKMMLMK